MAANTIVSLVILYCGIISLNCIQLVPERTTLTYVNQKYVTNLTVNVRRSSKRGEYVFNTFGYFDVPFGNNVSFHVYLYEHSSKYNHYIKSFIEFHYKLCDMINKDPLFGAIIRKQGVTKCPIQPGPISWTNMTLSAEFGFDIPFEKGKAEGKVRSETGNEWIAVCDVIFKVQRSKTKHG